MLRLNKIKNPFSHLSEEEWNKYTHELEPHFTEEPYYEVIPWAKIKARIEDNARLSGFDLILRTTNNKAYCPDVHDYDWIQKTQWLFGYKNKRIIIHITFTEQFDEKSGWKNFVCIHTHIELPLEEVDVTKEYEAHLEETDICDIYTLERRFPYHNTLVKKNGRFYAKIYRQPCPPAGYVSNGGMVKPGITECYYKKAIESDEYENVLERDITPTFFTEWLEKNPIVQDKIEDIHMWGYSDTFVFCSNSFPISLLMDFLFLKKLLKTKVTEYIVNPWSRQCTSRVYESFWRDHGVEKGDCSILEGKVGCIWYPVYNAGEKNRDVREYEKLRFNLQLQKLIDIDLKSVIVY